MEMRLWSGADLAGTFPEPQDGFKLPHRRNMLVWPSLSGSGGYLMQRPETTYADVPSWAWSAAAISCGGALHRGQCLTFWISPALAWGPNGHAIVADHCRDAFDRHGAQADRALLASEGQQTLDQIASWADEHRVSHRETAPWHFVDIPLDANTYDDARDCRGGNCVVAKIGDFAKVLGDPSEDVVTRTQALKYLVHFIGDVHQPLHCEDEAIAAATRSGCRSTAKRRAFTQSGTTPFSRRRPIFRP